MKPTKAELYIFKRAFPGVDIGKTKFSIVPARIIMVWYWKDEYPPRRNIVQKQVELKEFRVQFMRSDGSIHIGQATIAYDPEMNTGYIQEGKYKSYRVSDLIGELP